MAGRNTALLVIDAQNDILAAAAGRDGVVANIGGLVAKARADGVPVIWIQHSDDGLPLGSAGWQLVPELPRQDGDPLVHKLYGDSFEATDLAEILAGRGVGRLVVAGAQTDACIRATIHGAFVRGYDVTLVSDAHTTDDRSAVRRPARRADHRAHQPVLDLPVRPRPHRGSVPRGGGHLHAPSGIYPAERSEQPGETFIRHTVAA